MEQSARDRDRGEKTYHRVNTKLYDLPTPTAIVRNKSNRARLQVLHRARVHVGNQIIRAEMGDEEDPKYEYIL